MVGAPPALTAACGADALGHAIEGVVSASGTPMSKCLGAEAARIVFENLERACGNGSDIHARSQMAWAATLAGLALGSAGTIATHAMSHALGALLHLPHGAGVAALTPALLRYCLGSAEADLLRLARALGKSHAEEFIAAVEELLSTVGLPAEVGVGADSWSDHLPKRLAANAAESAPVAVRNTPRPIDEEGMAEVFAQILRRAP